MPRRGHVLALRHARAVRATALLRTILPGSRLHARALLLHAGHAPALSSCDGAAPAAFAERLAGSAIHRIGHERWLRNIAVGLGNAGTSPEIIVALQARADHPSALVREHVRWALARHVGAGLPAIDLAPS